MKIDDSGIHVMFNLSRTHWLSAASTYTWLTLRISGLPWHWPDSSIFLLPDNREPCSCEKRIPCSPCEPGDWPRRLLDHSCQPLFWGYSRKDTGIKILSCFSHILWRTPWKLNMYKLFCVSHARPTFQKLSSCVLEIPSRGNGSVGKVLAERAWGSWV